MKRVALTFIGKDRPGLIAEITRNLFDAGCNIEDTTMTLLEGEFAMILIATLPTPAVEKKLLKAFKRLRSRWGLYCFLKAVAGGVVRGEKHPPGTEIYVISVAGRDRTGIVYETSRVLAQYKLNITDLNSKILGKGNKSVFTMIMEVDVPKRFNMKKLESSWCKLREKLGLDVSVRRLERLSF